MVNKSSTNLITIKSIRFNYHQIRFIEDNNNYNKSLKSNPLIYSNIPSQTQSGIMWKLEFAISSSSSFFVGYDNDRRRSTTMTGGSRRQWRCAVNFNRPLWAKIKANYGIKWAWVINNTTNAKKVSNLCF
jgi:hypothetical protein